MKTSYLVIWQYGHDEKSKTETPIDVIINDVNSAEEKYERICRALEKETGEYESVIILGIFKL
jgi:hypothetical protein